MRSGSRNRRRHLGVDFAIWKSGGVWIWLLINASGEGGTIGASANRAQAMCEGLPFDRRKIDGLLMGTARTREHVFR
jgi:hypothetical protein